jgi:hypothetical protein
MLEAFWGVSELHLPFLRHKRSSDQIFCTTNGSGHRHYKCKGTPISDSAHADEPHGSLFMYFRIFALLADYHVILSHVTGITWPIPTFADQLRSFPLISDDFRSFPIIFGDLWWFLPSADISRSLWTPIWYHAALWKFYSSVKQLPRTLACQDIKSAKPRQHTASAQHQSSDSEISW